jgi:hypothetical protein
MKVKDNIAEAGAADQFCSAHVHYCNNAGPKPASDASHTTLHPQLHRGITLFGEPRLPYRPEVESALRFFEGLDKGGLTNTRIPSVQQITRPTQNATRVDFLFPLWEPFMRCRTWVFVALLFLAVSTAQAAGLRARIPASLAGPAIEGLVWHPGAGPPQEIDGRGGRTLFAVNGCPITGDKLPLMVGAL